MSKKTIVIAWFGILAAVATTLESMSYGALAGLLTVGLSTMGVVFFFDLFFVRSAKATNEA